MSKKSKWLRLPYIILLNMLLILGIFFGFIAMKDAKKIKHLNEDYFSANQISLGVLNADNWTNQVNTIIQMQVDSFSLSSKNEKILKVEIENILNRLFDELEIVIKEKQEGFTDKVKFGLIRRIVDLDKFRGEIPRFSAAILDEIDKASHKKEIKELLKENVSRALSGKTHDALETRESILAKYDTQDLEHFNSLIEKRVEKLEYNQRNYSWILIGLMICMLLTWIIALKMRQLLILTFIYCVLLAFVNLVIAINLPMIEIDARIDQMDIEVLSSHIIFKDQVIFFQSKSIFDVFILMISKGKIDTIFVGVLVFVFSVIFPAFKLICSIIYLFLKEKAGKVVKYIAFKSGKWSMADVMVIAIFMAYVGFQGILDAQLDNLHRSEDNINLLSTNRTNLQYGYLVFVSFVLSNLILSEILKLITRRNLLEENKPEKMDTTKAE